MNNSPSIHLRGGRWANCPSDKRLIFVRWSSTVKLARRLLNWKTETGEESVFSLRSRLTGKLFLQIWFHQNATVTFLGFRLVYRAGNICNHFFTRDFLQVRFQISTNSLNFLIFSECARIAHFPKFLCFITQPVCEKHEKQISIIHLSIIKFRQLSFSASVWEAREATASSRC